MTLVLTFILWVVVTQWWAWRTPRPPRITWLYRVGSGPPPNKNR